MHDTEQVNKRSLLKQQMWFGDITPSKLRNELGDRSLPKQRHLFQDLAWKW